MLIPVLSAEKWYLSLFFAAAAAAQEGIVEQARQVPVAYEVDVVVAGGSTGAVAAAAAAAQGGAKVFLAAPRPYLGEDLCAPIRLWLPEGRVPTDPLVKELFSAGNPAKPMHVKRTLDEQLLKAGVQFLYGCYATDLIVDEAGVPSGMVMANRGGRQAILAKLVIDATERGVLTKLAGAQVAPVQFGSCTFRRVVLGGEPKAAADCQVRQLPPVAGGAKGKPHAAFEYTLKLEMKDGSFASLAGAEQAARDRTYHEQQVGASETLWFISPERMKGARTLSGQWPGAATVELGAFSPAGVKSLYVLGTLADVERPAAEKLAEPDQLAAVGRRIGSAAAQEAKARAKPQGCRVAVKAAPAAARGEVRELLNGVRPVHEGLAAIPQGDRALPVLGRYDVVVVGGGTSGAPAGIAAARQGAKTLVIEYLHGLGGVGTLGAITKYYHGYRGGFTQEVYGGAASWPIEAKMEWWRKTLRQAGGEVWFGVLGCGALVEHDRVRGAIVATPDGRGVVLAKVLIDATGNADVPVSAGAACVTTDQGEVAVQGTGLPPLNPGVAYTNTDYTFTDDADVVDVWRLLVCAKEKYGGNYDLGQLVDSRERRRIVGDLTVSLLDQLNQRTYPDTVMMASSNYDTHGYTVEPLLMLKPPDRGAIRSYVPYRCLLPRGLDGILVVGLGLSAHRDAIPIVRMQPDLQNLGYAAGCAAAQLARSGLPTRQLDIRRLQQHLVDTGNLPANVLTDQDSYPFPPEKIAAAVQALKNDYDGAVVVLSHFEQARPLLREAYRKAAGPEKLIYAHALGMLGEADGYEPLAERVQSAPAWDKGWNFRGMGQYGASVSRLDSYIIALGKTGDRRAIEIIGARAKQLTEQSEFSHFRAVALALENFSDPRAAAVLATLLDLPGVSGHAVQTLEEAKSKGENRSLCLRELALARALLRCGDKDGLGRKILGQYEKDLRGHFARHAHAVLKAAPAK